MQKNLCILTLAVLALAIPAVAKTPDGQPPSEETICDSYMGSAYGLCTAYCEAMDCDSPERHASATACSKVGSHFMRVTGSNLPCNATCPCLSLTLFASFVNGTATISACSSGGGMSTVVGPNGSVVVTNDLTCSQNGVGPVIGPLTQNEADFCRQLLRDASAAQGVICTQPE
jgi:hypothetical protein